MLRTVKLITLNKPVTKSYTGAIASLNRFQAATNWLPIMLANEEKAAVKPPTPASESPALKASMEALNKAIGPEANVPILPISLKALLKPLPNWLKMLDTPGILSPKRIKISSIVVRPVKLNTLRKILPKANIPLAAIVIPLVMLARANPNLGKFVLANKPLMASKGLGFKAAARLPLARELFIPLIYDATPFRAVPKPMNGFLTLVARIIMLYSPPPFTNTAVWL